MVTVILCSRNGEAYIEKQIDSILSQSVNGLCLYVYDDASTDSTPEILKRYAEKYPEKVHITLREKPTGSSAANFLSAIKEAPKSDYYMLSDQDDVWHRGKAFKMVNSIYTKERTSGSDKPLMIFSDAKVVDDNLNEICPSFVKFADLSPERVDFNHLLLQNQVTGAAGIFNYALKGLIEAYPTPEKPAMHDHWMAILCSAFGEISYIDECLYDYRQHGDNVLGAKKASFIGETARRLGLGKESKSEIDAITKAEFARVYSQAGEFLRIYSDKLTDKQKEACAAMADIPNKNKLGRVSTVLKYHFTFNNFYRFVGELIFI